ncbi:hypothetical protein BCO9919_04975 [Burkholderia cenocepacia]|uniref:Uncharacterized protein n=1 Tax=Burkholderia cenocepacia TaxID=95486 RepID=A0A6J5JIY0_9BURK|nr:MULTISPECIES: hypothetical protein [Burkholderia cepacia complex]CAB3971773.1 hypothetical protein BCO9919_04975 [Burkholderia cenocepacia]
MKYAIVRALALAWLLLSGFVCAAELKLVDHIYAGKADMPADFRHFMFLRGAPSRSAALKVMNCVKKTYPSLAVGAYEFPVGVGHDTYPGGVRYPIALAAYANSDEARDAENYAREHVDLGLIAHCLGIPVSRAGEDVSRTYFFGKAIELKTDELPRLITRSEIGAFDGEGHGAFVTGSETTRVIVLPKAYASSASDDVASTVMHLRAMHPETHFFAIRHSGYEYVATAALTDAATVERARRQMRRLGLYSSVELQLEASDSIGQSGAQLQGTLFDGSTQVVDRPVLNLVKTIAKLEVLQADDVTEPLRDRVLRCYGRLPAEVEKTVDVDFDKLASCSGVLMDRIALTRCVLDSDCRGIRVPIRYDAPPKELVIACLEGSSLIDCEGTTIDRKFNALLKDVGYTSCGFSTSCPGIKQKLVEWCRKANGNCSDELVAQFSTRIEEIGACVNDGKCDRIVPRSLQVDALVAQQKARLLEAGQNVIGVTEKGLAFVDNAKDTAKRIGDCYSLSRSAGNDAGQDCLAKISLGPTEQGVFDCFEASGADSSKQLDCIKGEPAARQSIELVQCVQAAHGDAGQLLACPGVANDPRIGQARAALQCVQNVQEPLDAMAQCVQGVPDTVAIALRCAKSASDGDYLNCLPRNGKEVAIARCLASADSDAARVMCVTPEINMPPAVRAALGCVASADGDSSAMATCAAGQFLPPEVARVTSCAAGSSGATDFAICASGIAMSPEWRIAAECAASSGGVPVTFAGCTAGRLTIRELGKCLSGKIGEPGGCFGPSNDIVKAFNTVGSDFSHGLGANNDIVQFGERVGTALRGVSDAGRDILAGIGNFGEDVFRGIGSALGL